MAIRKGRTTGVERREQILDAALGLFAEHGIQHVSTRQIAQIVGISQPSLYAHFATSEAIAVELCCRAFDRLRQRMTDVLAIAGTPAERMLRAAREYVRFGLDEPAMYRVAFVLESSSKSAADAESPALAAGVASFTVFLDFFREVRAASDEATDIAAQSAWASLHGLVALLLVRRDFPWADRERLIDYHLARTCAAAMIGVAPVGANALRGASAGG
jgi:AcrR family transcriptional regulator